MCVPLRDQYGKVRYFLGAQLDITGLVLACTELDSLRRLVEQQSAKPEKNGSAPEIVEAHQHDAFEQLSETFNPRELEALFASRGQPHPSRKEHKDTTGDSGQQYIHDASLKDSSANLNSIFHLNGQGSAPPLGFYQNVRLVTVSIWDWSPANRNSTFLSDLTPLSESCSHPLTFRWLEYCKLP